MMRASWLPPDGSAREVEDRTDVVAAAWGSACEVEAILQTSLAPRRHGCSMRLTPRLQLE